MKNSTINITDTNNLKARLKTPCGTFWNRVVKVCAWVAGSIFAFLLACHFVFEISLPDMVQVVLLSVACLFGGSGLSGHLLGIDPGRIHRP